jgi:hypothetical protein
VAIDPASNQVIYAGNFFSLDDFSDHTAFYRGDGSVAFVAAAGSSFRDFEVSGGQLFAAVNTLDDGHIYATDGSSVSVESLTGSKALFADGGLTSTDDGIYLALTGAGGSFVVGYALEGGDPLLEAVNVLVDWNGDGTPDEQVRSPLTGGAAQLAMKHVFLAAGKYAASVTVQDMDGAQLGTAALSVDVATHRLIQEDPTTPPAQGSCVITVPLNPTGCGVYM